MNDVLLYRERLPRYVFNGSNSNRNLIRIARGIVRLLIVFLFASIIFLIATPTTDHDLLPVWGGAITIALLCVVLIYRTEYLFQAEIDGSIQTIIYGDCITIPTRFHRRVFNMPDSIQKDDIDHVRVIRGKAGHIIERYQVLFWEDSPIGIEIITRSGRKYGTGYKPPSTVKDIIDVLMTHWNIRIDDPGSGMGHGRLCGKEGPMWERSYEEIMAMDLFEWQE